MLKILALPPVSQDKEQEPAPQEVQIMPSEDGIFRNPELMGGVSIKVASSDQAGAVLKIYFDNFYNRGEYEYDVWIGGVKNGSMINLAITQILSNLLQGKDLPSDIDQRITLTDFNLPTGTIVKFSVMEKFSLEGWKKLSDIQLSYTP